MTESEWLAYKDPESLESYLWQSLPKGQTRLNFRKLGLFCVACCRRIWPLLIDERSRRAVECFENHLDQLPNHIIDEEVIADAMAAEDHLRELYIQNPGHLTAAYLIATETVYILIQELSLGCSRAAVQKSTASALTRSQMRPDQPHRMLDLCGDGSGVNFDVPQPSPATDELQAQANLLRDIFGNPFHPVIIDPSWQSNNVLELARNIYQEKAFDGIPVLADALEESGCNGTQLLDHCRQPKSHVRGCWAIDLILGKT
jgi:hypothetical protein